MKRPLIACAIVGLLTAGAYAGPLAADANSIPAFTGTTVFNDGSGFVVDVDFAVFAPGHYALDGTTDPSAGARYVYAYQIFPVGAVPLQDLSIGRDPPFAAILNAGNDPAHFQVGGQAATLVSVTSNSVIALYVPAIVPTAFSQVLLFTSDGAPTMFASSVDGPGAQHDQRLLPTPVPEPATAGLAILGWAAWKRRRR